MDAPLGYAVGNALEVAECVDVLKGSGPADLIEVSVELTARMLVLGGIAQDRSAARQRVHAAIDSGEGLERFRRIIQTQGGDPRVVDDPSRLPAAPHRHVVKATRAGFVTAIDAGLIGRAAGGLGAGRDRAEDPVDPAVGIMLLVKPGQPVSAGDGVFELHYRDRARLDPALALAERALVIDAAPPAPSPLVVAEVS
jgi:thymidine phosphorylase